MIAAGGVQTDKTKESVAEFITEMKALAGGKPIYDTEVTNRAAPEYGAMRSSSSRSTGWPDRFSICGATGPADDRVAARVRRDRQGVRDGTRTMPMPLMFETLERELARASARSISWSRSARTRR